MTGSRVLRSRSTLCNGLLVAGFLIAVAVAAVCAAFVGVEFTRLTQRTGFCTRLPSSGRLSTLGGASAFESEDQFRRFTVVKNRTSDVAKALVVCFNADDSTSGSIFFSDERYQLHFDFANEVLGITSSRIAFDSLTYFTPTRSIIAATLSRSAPGEFYVQFWPTDELSANDIVRTYRLMRQAVQPWSTKLVWVPGGEAQRQTATKSAAQLQAADVRVEFSLSETRQQVIYNAGSSVGYLRRGEANQLDANAIALFGGNAPPDMSRVAGIISSQPQSPLSHTNVRAVQNKVPNVYVGDAVARFAALVDRAVRLTADDVGNVVLVELATPEELQAAIAARRPVPIQLPAANLNVTACMALDDLRAANASFVGAKAANVAELLRVKGLSVDLPRGFAVPFALFQAHMSAPRSASELLGAQNASNSGGRQAVLAALVAGDASLSLWTMTQRALALRRFADDWLARGNATFDWRAQAAPFNHAGVAFLLNDTTGDARGGALALTVVREAIRAAPVQADVDSSIDAAVANFTGGAPIASLRCRSSGSAEDLVDFSGAGLYDSFTHKFSSRLPLSATVKRVWASFLTLRAVAERDAAGIDHAQVLMGVLVHPNYGTEQANGVAVTANLLGPRPFPFEGRDVFVNAQYGEVSVVTPPVNSSGIAPTPDVYVTSTVYRVHTFNALSSLRASPSATVLTSDESLALADNLIAIHRHFVLTYAERRVCAFDLEWKVQAAGQGRRGQLAVKQVRPMAWGDESCASSPAIPPDRLGEPDALPPSGIAALVGLCLALLAATIIGVCIFLPLLKTVHVQRASRPDQLIGNADEQEMESARDP
jgi:hypothetical protein